MIYKKYFIVIYYIMLKELFNENLILTTLLLFIVIYVVMNIESIKKGVYITPNYINPLLFSLASVVILKFIFSLCDCSGSRSKIEQIHIENYDIPDGMLKGGSKYALNKMPKRNTFIPYE